MVKIAFITSVFGGIDIPKVIPHQKTDFTHYHFSEANNARFLDHLNDRMKSLYFKAQHHKVVEAEYYIYTDGKIQVLSENFIDQALEQLQGVDVAFLKHAERSCVYEEVDFIESEISKGNKYLSTRYADRDLRGEVENYRSLGYPENNGLFDCSIFIHKNTRPANRLFDLWWYRIHEGKFDQTAIRHASWQSGVRINSLEFRPNSFKLVNHKKLK